VDHLIVADLSSSTPPASHALALLLPPDHTLSGAQPGLSKPQLKAARLTLEQPSTPRDPGTVTSFTDKPGHPPHLIGFTGTDAASWTRLGAALLKSARQSRTEAITLVIAKGVKPKPEQWEALAVGMELARLRIDQFKGAATPRPTDLPESLTVLAPSAASGPLQRGVTLGSAVNTTRLLQATPPNIANPPYIEQFCRDLAKQTGLKCTVVNEEGAQQQNMGGLLAVGSGSKHAPRIVVLEWCPPELVDEKPTLIVGKAITFDTGGYNLKPDGGKGMKYDKSGGMVTIGILEAAARLNLKQRVVGLVSCAENMIGQNAYRPDDILTFSNGVTVEITNTDAEGRLVLADALHYGTKKYAPKQVIDLATLTGAIVVALGTDTAGMFCNDTKLRGQLQRAAEETGEAVWHMPLSQAHRKMLKSEHADIMNAGTRKAGSCTAAAFLSHFVGENAPNELPTIPWAHLDIAGTAVADGDDPVCGKGPTGYGVRLVTELLDG